MGFGVVSLTTDLKSPGRLRVQPGDEDWRARRLKAEDKRDGLDGSAY